MEARWRQFKVNHRWANDNIITGCCWIPSRHSRRTSGFRFALVSGVIVTAHSQRVAYDCFETALARCLFMAHRIWTARRVGTSKLDRKERNGWRNRNHLRTSDDNTLRRHGHNRQITFLCIASSCHRFVCMLLEPARITSQRCWRISTCGLLSREPHSPQRYLEWKRHSRKVCYACLENEVLTKYITGKLCWSQL